jgi:cytosine/adenosine deaminase-related metal-dependent hydrolase
MAAVLVLAGFGYGQSSGSAPAEKGPKTTYIVAGWLFDATGETVRQNVVIVVEDERIKSVVSNSGSAIPAGATVIDLSHSTALPGLIDCHTHLASRADRDNEIYRFRTTPLDYAFNAVVMRRKRWRQDTLRCAMWDRRHSLRSICATRSMKDSFQARVLWPAVRESRLLVGREI